MSSSSPSSSKPAPVTMSVLRVAFARILPDRRMAPVPAQGTLPRRRAAVSASLLRVARSLPSLRLRLALAPSGRPPPWRALPLPGFALPPPRGPL
jgi:hypothetical protein